MTTTTPAADERPILQRLHVIRAHIWLVIAVAAVTTAGALAYSLLKTPTYTATSTVDFSQQGSESSVLGGTVTPDFQPAQVAAAQAKTVTRDDVVRRVKSALKTQMSMSSLRDSVATSVDPSSNLVAIEATADSGPKAAHIANEFAIQTKAASVKSQRAQYARAAKRLQGRLHTLSKSGLDPSTRALYSSGISRLLALSTFAQPVRVASLASVPASPSSPKPLVDTGLGLILGLILGVLAAFGRDAIDRRFTDSRDVERRLEFPVVGQVPRDALGRGRSTGAGDFSEADLDAFRILRSNVRFLDVDRELKTILITSPVAEEGKSTVAAGMAFANSVGGRRTLLVECDLRRPVLAERLGLKEGPGLTDYLVGNARLDEILQEVSFDLDHLSSNGATREGAEAESPEHAFLPAPVMPCVTAGSHALRPTEMLASRRFRQFLEQARSQYELVVLDTAPVLPVGDTLELIPQVDGVVICVRLYQTTPDQALAAQTALSRLPSRPIGVAVTGIRPRAAGYYGYGGYGGGYGALTKSPG